MAGARGDETEKGFHIMATTRKRGRPRGARLSNMSYEALHAELERRQRELGKLLTQRERLLSNLEDLDSKIESLGGGVVSTAGGGGGAAGGARRGRRKKAAAGRPRGRARAGGGRRRPRNEMNLVEALRKTLSGKTMSVTEVAEAVQREGYKTTSDNFRTIVNQTLINSGQFKRVARGQYTAK